MSFQDFLRQDVRLVLLRVLTEMPAYRSNSSVLGSALERYGHAVTRDQVKTELAWLAEHLNELPGSGIVYTLTTRDADRVAGWLRENGMAAESYHADKTHEDRLLLEQALQAAQARVVESSGRMALSGGYNLQQIINNPNLPSKHLRPDMTGEFRRMYEYIYEQRW